LEGTDWRSDSYEDLEQTRAKRAEKEAAKKPKARANVVGSATLEADAPEPNAKVARMSGMPTQTRASVVQMSGTPVAEDEIVPESWRALVARRMRKVRLPYEGSKINELVLNLDRFEIGSRWLRNLLLYSKVGLRHPFSAIIII